MPHKNLNSRRRISLPTKLTIGFVGCAFFVANICEYQLVKYYGLWPEKDWNLAAKFFFTRGWPFSPWMVCERYGNRWHPEAKFTWGILVLDAIIAFTTLGAVGVLSEWLIKKLGKIQASIMASDQQQIHFATIIIGVIITGTFLWANTRESVRFEVLNTCPLDGYGAIGKYFFRIGWPLSPWMFTIRYGHRWHPEESFIWAPLVVDALIAFDTLIIAIFLSEWTIQKWKRRHARG